MDKNNPNYPQYCIGKWKGKFQDDYTDEEIQELRARWENNSRLNKLVKSILLKTRGVRTHNEVLNSYNQANKILTTQGFEPLNYNKGSNLELYSLDLRGTFVFDSDDFQRIALNFTRLEGAGFNCTPLDGAFLNAANLYKVIFSKCSMKEAQLKEANLNYAHLRNSNLQGADLSRSCLKKADLFGVNFNNARLCNVTWHGPIKFRCFHWIEKDGKRKFDWNSIIPYIEHEGLPKVEGTSIEGADFANSRQFERYIKDEQFLQEYKKKAQSNKWLKTILWFWKFTSDYGRSFGRWAVLSFLIAIIWGVFYIGFGQNRFDLNSGGTDWSWFAPFYYSFVTMTTLGFGDITPKVDQWFLQIVVTFEVVLGYIMLGGLISIFSNKLARRAS